MVVVYLYMKKIFLFLFLVSSFSNSLAVTKAIVVLLPTPLTNTQIAIVDKRILSFETSSKECLAKFTNTITECNEGVISNSTNQIIIKAFNDLQNAINNDKLYSITASKSNTGNTKISAIYIKSANIEKIIKSIKLDSWSKKKYDLDSNVENFMNNCIKPLQLLTGVVKSKLTDICYYTN